MRSLCYKRPFGVKSDSVILYFPKIQDFEMIAYAEPEYRFNVIMPNDETMLKLLYLIPNSMFRQKEVLIYVWQQTGTIF